MLVKDGNIYGVLKQLEHANGATYVQNGKKIGLPLHGDDHYHGHHPQPHLQVQNKDHHKAQINCAQNILNKYAL